MDPATLSASIVAAAVANVTFACAVGVCLTVLMLGDAPPLMRQQLQRLAGGCVATLIVADIINLLLEAALMSGSAPTAALPVLIPVLTQSHFGAVWSCGFVAVIVWTGLWFGSRDFGRPIRTSVALLAAAVFAFSKAASSHAADAGDFTPPEWIHWVHLCATAAWAGLVIASGLCVLPLLRDHADKQGVARFVRRLSAAATVALMAVLMSGIYNAERGLGGTLVPLMHSDWGRILATKLVLVAVAIVLGGFNRLVYLPRVRHGAPGSATHAFVTILRVEAVTMIGVLSAAAVLAHTAPVAHLGI